MTVTRHGLARRWPIAAWAALIGLMAAAGSCGASALAQAADETAGEASLALPAGAGACDATTAAVAKSCGKQTVADYLLALGACANVATAGGRERCTKQAAADLRAGPQDCQEQKQARAQVCELVGQAPYDPPIDTGNFGPNITNRYFPLPPGTVLVYHAPDSVVTVTVLRETVKIDGVTCRVVRDTNVVAGKVAEDTLDYYAQDRAGNVWYFGEATAEFENGVSVATDGSFVSGVGGAKPGIIMLAAPTPGKGYRQEFELADAEDVARVVSLGQSVTVPFGTFHNALKTLEFTPLEPGLYENKYYVPGVGNVKTVDLDTGETEVLVSVKH
jgi:hypothetical protein